MSNCRSVAEVTGLFVYPVKSMRGIAVDSARLTAVGLEHDRRFMVVRSNGDFVTQRNQPLLSQIDTALEPGGIILSRPGFGQVLVPFDAEGGKVLQTRVWKDECSVSDEGEAVSRWLTEALESPDRLLLVAMQKGFVRPQGKADMLGEDTRTLFADAAPYLVANEASLAKLNRELRSRDHQAVPMNRFRPNILVKGLGPFAEHDLASLAGDSFTLRLAHACERCVVTTIDQSTGVKNPDWEPYKTLSTINPMPGRPNKPAFGHNAILESGENHRISLGNKLKILEID